MKYLLLILLAAPCLATGPRYRHPEAKLDDEVRTIYHEIDSVLKGDVRISSVTIGTAVVQNLYATNPNVSGRIIESSQTLIVGNTVTSTSYIGIQASSVTVTPTSTSQKVRIYFSLEMGNTADAVRCYASIFRNGTDLNTTGDGFAASQFNGTTTTMNRLSNYYEDSPASTSALIYNLRVKSGGGSCFANTFLGSNATSVLRADVISQ